jgi:hypothetical protein
VRHLKVAKRRFGSISAAPSHRTGGCYAPESCRHSRPTALATSCVAINAAGFSFPKVFKPIWSHFGISHRVHDIFVTYI